MSVKDETALVGLTGKVALVTGGGAGIGRSIAESFAAYGARIAVIEIDPARADAVSASLGPDALVVTGDADNVETVAQAMGEIEARFGRLDILVNNVGDFLMVRDKFGGTTEEQWDALYRVNLRNMF